LKFQKSLSRILRYCTAILDRAANGLQINIGFQNHVRCASTGSAWPCLPSPRRLARGGIDISCPIRAANMVS
jgi:hypothetical protein